MVSFGTISVSGAGETAFPKQLRPQTKFGNEGKISRLCQTENQLLDWWDTSAWFRGCVGGLIALIIVVGVVFGLAAWNNR